MKGPCPPPPGPNSSYAYGLFSRRDPAPRRRNCIYRPLSDLRLTELISRLLRYSYPKRCFPLGLLAWRVPANLLVRCVAAKLLTWRALPSEDQPRSKSVFFSSDVKSARTTTDLNIDTSTASVVLRSPYQKDKLCNRQRCASGKKESRRLGGATPCPSNIEMTKYEHIFR